MGVALGLRNRVCRLCWRRVWCMIVSSLKSEAFGGDV